MKIKQVIKGIDNKIKSVQPQTMDELLSTVFSVPYSSNYGFNFIIIQKDNLSVGVRVNLTGSKLIHSLPSSNGFYPVTQGMKKYIDSGYPVENIV
jgi:hypothetical protein